MRVSSTRKARKKRKRLLFQPLVPKFGIFFSFVAGRFPRQSFNFFKGKVMDQKDARCSPATGCEPSRIVTECPLERFSMFAFSSLFRSISAIVTNLSGSVCNRGFRDRNWRHKRASQVPVSGWFSSAQRRIRFTFFFFCYGTFFFCASTCVWVCVCVCVCCVGVCYYFRCSGALLETAGALDNGRCGRLCCTSDLFFVPIGLT